jgi:membrane protein YdbS with pleckstrin-like domain
MRGAGSTAPHLLTYLMSTMRRVLSRSTWRLAVLAAVSLFLLVPTPAFAGGYWTAFTKYWSSFVADADGVIVTVIIVGIISLLIITRGKWAK